MKKDKINRLIEIINEAKEIIAELEGYATKKEKQVKTIEQILATSILRTGLSTRAMNVLLMAEIKMVNDITKYTKKEIQNLHSRGSVSPNEIETQLNAVGIKLTQEEEN